MDKLWIIEARTPAGALDFADPQPEAVFGLKAIHGLTLDEVAQTIFRYRPNADLHGGNIAWWPRVLDPRWVARPKTWPKGSPRDASAPPWRIRRGGRDKPTCALGAWGALFRPFTDGKG